MHTSRLILFPFVRLFDGRLVGIIPLEAQPRAAIILRCLNRGGAPEALDPNGGVGVGQPWKTDLKI